MKKKTETNLETNGKSGLYEGEKERGGRGWGPRKGGK